MIVSSKRGRAASATLGYVVVAIAFLLAIMPVAWMLIVSFMPRTDIIADPPVLFPTGLTLENYSAVIDNEAVISGIRNGAIVAACTTLLSLAIGGIAAWGLSMYPFRGATRVLIAILATQMIPLTVLLIPLYEIFSTFGLIDNQLALALVYCSFTLPFTIWMAKGFFDAVPREIVEAAAIDGVSRFGAFFRIGLPLTRPGIIATAIFGFLLAWDEYILAVTLISSEQLRTMPPQLVLSFIGQFAYQWGPMMASGILVTVPVLALFIFFQRHIVAGLTAGAVKG